MHALPPYILILPFSLLSFSCQFEPDSVNLATFPGEPRGFSVSVDSYSQVTLAWETPENDGRKPITGYRIYRRVGGQGVHEIYLSNTNNPMTTFVDDDLDGGQTYSYRVSAISQIGVGAATSSISVVTDFGPPDAPGELQGSVASFDPGGSVILTWQTPERNGGADIVNYHIERESPVGDGFTEIDVMTIGNSYIDRTVSPLTEYQYRVTARNNVGLVSEASNIINITTGCPVGYVLVDSNSDFDIDDPFCVMQLEARNDGFELPATSPLFINTEPWVEITKENAQARCRALGPNYDLISNDEWMTLALQIESIPENWSSGVIGVGCLNAGNTGEAYSCSIDGLGLITGPFASRNLRARHSLGDARHIWDFAGNAWEWVDWTRGGTLDDAPGGCDGVEELENISSLIGCDLDTPDLYMPDNPEVIIPYNSSIYLGRASFTTGERGFVRGGSFNSERSAGVFALGTLDPAIEYVDVGFRCVYR